MKTSDFDYDLPASYIAQSPIEPRDASRMLVLDRSSGEILDSSFYNLRSFLNTGDLLVLNETRVIPARIFAKKFQTGGKVEILLVRKEGESTWECLVGGTSIQKGTRLKIDQGPGAKIILVLDGPRRVIQFDHPIEPYLDVIGNVPLPPYIHTPLSDPDRYQTVFAHQAGSVAAPTAGLHFTPELINTLQLSGIRFVRITLHVGLDTFAPVNEESPAQHRIHSEWCHISPQAAEEVNLTRWKGGRIIAVGTTSVRALESAVEVSGDEGKILSFHGLTDLFILPGYRFKIVDAMITNFHLPRSSLIMLVSAFAGRECILEAYQYAKERDYRFYSFGDAMLIL